MSYTNRKNFSVQQIEFLDNGLRISKKSPVDFVEYEIPFEQISNKKKIKSTISDGMLVTGISFFVFGLIILMIADTDPALFLMGLGLLLIIITFFRRISVVTIQTFVEDNITLHFNRRNKESVFDFADEIIARSNSFLLKKYGKIDRALAIEPQVENLQFLRNRNILTEEEYEQLKNQLLGRENQNAIGFSNR
jgi:hypothetical protein